MEMTQLQLALGWSYTNFSHDTMFSFVWVKHQPSLLPDVLVQDVTNIFEVTYTYSM